MGHRRPRPRRSPPLIGCTALVAVVVTAASACTPGYDGYDRLAAIEPEVTSACDADGVRLEFDAPYVGTKGDHSLRSVRVSDIDPACAGETLRLAVGAGTSDLGTGAATVDAGGTATIYFDPVVREIDDEGDVTIISNLEILADDVRVILVRIGT